MKLKLPKVKLNKGTSSSSSIRSFFAKIKDFFKSDKFKRFWKIFSFLKTRLAITIIITILFVCATVETVFAVMVYGFKMDNKATQLVTNIVPYPAAVANQDFVTYREFQKEKKYIHHFYNATQQTSLDFASIDKEILNQLVENKLIAFQALRYRIRVNQSDIDTSVNQIIDQNGGQEKVNQALDELYGLNLKQFEELVKTQMLREKVSQELIARVKVSHILILVDKDATPDKVDAAKVKIDGIKKEIDGGLDFAEAAKKYSEDTGSAEAGGSLDAFTKGEMVQAFSDAAFNTPVGKISDPVRTEYGWHIIKVENKTGKINESFDDWLTGIKNKSLILKFI